jgi:hypothetical protein
MIGSVSGHYGETIQVPEPGPGEVVYVRIHGAGLGTLERVTNFLLHARTRHILVNGTTSYRLIPETAGDGLLMWGSQELFEEDGDVSPLPQAQTIELEGASGNLTFDFYAMKVAPGSTATAEPKG